VAPSRGTQLCLATRPCRTAQYWGQPCTNNTLWYGRITDCIQAYLCDRLEGPTAQLLKEAHLSPPDKEPSSSTPQEDLSWSLNVQVIDVKVTFKPSSMANPTWTIYQIRVGKAFIFTWNLWNDWILPAKH